MEPHYEHAISVASQPSTDPGTRCRDFNIAPSFYLTSSLAWAAKTARRNGCVVAFKVPRQLVRQYFFSLMPAPTAADDAPQPAVGDDPLDVPAAPPGNLVVSQEWNRPLPLHQIIGDITRDSPSTADFRETVMWRRLVWMCRSHLDEEADTQLFRKLHRDMIGFCGPLLKRTRRWQDPSWVREPLCCTLQNAHGGEPGQDPHVIPIQFCISRRDGIDTLGLTDARILCWTPID